jgi:hypothetical protein
MYRVPKITSNLGKELVRRGVLRALGAYIFLVWALAVGLVDLLPAIGFPDWAIRAFLGAAIGAIPLVAVVAWKYDLTTKGFLPDKQDLANRARLRGDAGSGPTTRVSPRKDRGKSFVVVNWTDEQGAKCEKEFDSRFQVGRDMQADIRLWDDRVSRRHLEIYPVGDQWFARDLASLNGTYVDGEPIEVHRIDSQADVSLDRGGPVIRISVKAVNDTMMTAKTTDGAQIGK